MTIQTALGTDRISRSGEAAAAGKVSKLPAVFVVCCVIPFIITAGDMNLSPNRIFLLIMLLPSLLYWMMGGAGRQRFADYCILLFTFWSALSFIVIDGFDASVQPIGMWVIETCGAYFFARVFVRNAAQFMSVVRTFFWVLVCLIPFAYYEIFKREAIIIQILSKIGKTIPSIYGDAEARLGLRRAQVSFEHPILYGVFASYGAALFTYAFEKGQVTIKSGRHAIVSAAATFCSLSTGAYLSVVIQMLCTGWDYVTRNVKHRWWILFWIFVVCYVIIDALSNRTPFEVFITYLTFDSSTAYNRVMIWEYGTAQVMRTPIFGTGIATEWERPWWMVSSMDNFFLVLAVRHGLPACILMMLAVFLNLKDVTKAPLKSQKYRNLRLGYILTMVGVIVASVTVHFWTATYVFFVFWLGAGVWFSDVGLQDEEKNEQPVKAKSELETQKKSLNYRPATRPNQVVAATSARMPHGMKPRRRS
jgi:hypothetical protein